MPAVPAVKLLLAAALSVAVVVAAPGTAAADDPAPPATEAPAVSPSATEAPAVSPDEVIVVTGLRLPRPLQDVPAAVTVIDHDQLRRAPEPLADDLVRVVPSVGTFRRSSSAIADPTSQGLNLRGVGPSGVSRALVLRDGVPVNDPFGGWVYWRAMSPLGIDRIEIVPSGASALFGNFALGGVLQVISRPIDRPVDRRRRSRAARSVRGGRRRAPPSASASSASRWTPSRCTATATRRSRPPSAARSTVRRRARTTPPVCASSTSAATPPRTPRRGCSPNRSTPAPSTRRPTSAR